MSNIFNKAKETTPESTMVTGTQNSLNSGLAGSLETNELETMEGSTGYISPGASCVTLKDGTKVKGISTDKGFFYPSELDEEAIEAVKVLVKRGFAYDLSSDS